MQVQVNTDNHIHGSEALSNHVASVVEGTLDRFSSRITRVEVHLKDVNGAKSGTDDNHCTMEARLTGLQPVAVTHEAANMDQAIDGAAEKLERLIDSTLGKLKDQ